MNRFGVLAILLVAGCNVPVQQGLDESAANEVVTALARSGLAAKKKPDGDESSDAKRFSISVAQGDAPAAIEIINSRGLPRTAQSGFAQIYAEPSLIPSASEERARFIAALTGEIERTLTSVDGIVGARVHVVPEQRDVMAPQEPAQTPARAAVLLKVDPGSAGLHDDQVRALVAGTVPGLLPAAVVVVRTQIAHVPAAREPMVGLGPLRVSAASRVPIVVGLALGMGALVTMAVLLLVAARRLAAREAA